MAVENPIKEMDPGLGEVSLPLPPSQNLQPEPEKLPPISQVMGQGNPVPAELRQAWNDYMVNGFKHNEEMFQRTLNAFMKPYSITIGMYVVIFIVGISLFVLAAYLGIRGDQSVAAVAFGGLSVASFVIFFIRQPVQALEENLEFINWLGVAFNTYWTRLMYMNNINTIQSDLKSATDDYSSMVEELINKHAELHGNRPGAKPGQE
jgi:hypothetical protein